MFSSARMRRRFAWLGVLVLVAGAIAGLVLLFPGSKPWSAEKMLKAKASIVRTPKQRSFAPRAYPVLTTAREFVQDGVEGKNLGASWKYVGPAMRRGFTKRTWVHGSSLPFNLYPADLRKTRLNISFSYTTEVGVRLLLFARPHAKVTPRGIAFDLVERKYGHGPKTRWLVSSFTPAPTPGGDSVRSRATLGSAAAGADPTRHTSALWLFLPLGIFAGLLLGLIAFFSIRSWRNAAVYRAYFEDRQTSSWRPS